MPRKPFTYILILLLTALSACSIPDAGPAATATPAQTAVPTKAPTPTASPSKPEIPRIGIRMNGDAAEFYNTGSGETFTPRGVNYVELVATERAGSFEDRVMATNRYDPNKVRGAFQHLAELGYNTVRIFFDTCGSGPYCIGNPSRSGLNPDYLDNMVDLMHIAVEEGIYIIFTANSVPEEGGYWSYFDRQLSEDANPGFDSYMNADWLHPAGVEIKRRFWHDLMSGLAERDAPFETVLGWQLTNEFWLFKNAPPLSLDSGMVTTANGETYDMADPEQKRQMVTDGTLYFMNEIIPIIKLYDPEALTTMGFFAPQFPNPTGIGGDWYVDTAPLIETAPLDFWDLHAYYDADLTIQQQAENFGIIGYQAKPIIMGETGSGPEFVPSAASSLTAGVHWIAESCQYGFDGWLYWGYYPWPKDMGGKPWAALEDDELILKGMAPINQPDACVVPELAVSNIAFDQPARASRFLLGETPANAVDSSSIGWNSGDYPPQWIEIELAEPSTVQRVAMTTQQWPPGVTRHEVWARLSGGEMVFLGLLDNFTTVDMNLVLELPVPLEDVAAVRVETDVSPSWVGWREIEVISAPPPAEPACLAETINPAPLYPDPVPGGESNGRITHGILVYLNGFYQLEDDITWWQTGGGTWIEDEYLRLSDDCANAPRLEREPRMIPVTITVQVPENTIGDVFLAGEFGGTDIPTWLPWSVLLTQQDTTTYQVTIPLPVGAEVTYKYTRGNWDSVEQGLNCAEVANRSFTVTDTALMTVTDQVTTWRDLGNCN